MPILCDSNILLRLAQPQHSHYPIVLRAFKALYGRNQRLCITQQNLVEFWAVATRPASANGLGFSIFQAELELSRLTSFFPLLIERPLHPEWQSLVIRYNVTGKSVHDARLVAAMLVHGITDLLTFNTADFARYQEVTAIDPAHLRDPPYQPQLHLAPSQRDSGPLETSADTIIRVTY